MKKTSQTLHTPAYSEVILDSHKATIALSVWHNHADATSILFCPSTMASPLLHTFFLTRLWRMGFNVIGLHPVGHGKASRPRCFTFDDIVQNSMDAAQWIRAHYSGPVVVSGHSQGGILALAHACHDTKIAAVFPICTLLPTHPAAGSVTLFSGLLRYKEHVLRLLYHMNHLCPALPVFIPMYLSMKRVLAGAYRTQGNWDALRPFYPLSFVYSLFTADLSIAMTRGLACPLVLITARDDALFTPELMQTMLDCICAPYKKLLLINGGGHMMPLSLVYATMCASQIAAHCAGLGLPIRTQN